mgnify:CR=1 FL=1
MIELQTKIEEFMHEKKEHKDAKHHKKAHHHLMKAHELLSKAGEHHAKPHKKVAAKKAHSKKHGE